MAKLCVHLTLLHQVRELIVCGELPDEGRIPEEALCERFGVSRTPLREVLKVLAAEGHLRLLPNRGARVKKLTFDEVQGLFDVTGALEALAGEQCCLQITEIEAERLSALHARMMACHRDGDLHEYYRCNRAIHEGVIEGTHNPVLIELHGRVNARIRRVRFTTPMTPHIWNRAVAEHDGMMNALARRDGATLSSILKTHLTHKSQAIVGMMKDQGAPAARSAS